MVVCKFFQQGNCRYGQSCRFEHMYGSKYSYRAPQVQNNTGQIPSGQGLNNTASSVFRNAVRNISSLENTASHTLVNSPLQRPSVFDRLGPPQSSFGSQNNEARSFFAQANQNIFGPTQSTINIFQNHNWSTPNVFQMQNQTNAKTLFAQATQSIFGQNHPHTSTNFVTEVQTNPHNLNNTNMNVTKVRNRSTSNVFAMTDSNIDNDVEYYSKMEDLSQSDKEAFESIDFKLGFIPELPPPKILCV